MDEQLVKTITPVSIQTHALYIKKRSFIIIDNDKFNVTSVDINIDDDYQQNGFYQIMYKSPSFIIDGITLETPWMFISKPLYKISQSNDKNFIEATFKNIEKDSQIFNFFRLIQDLDHHMIKKLAEFNTHLIYGKNIRLVDNHNNSEFKYPYIKLKLNIIQKYIEFNNIQVKNIKQFFDKVDISNSIAKCFIQCNGVWNYNGRLGMTWKIISMKINKDVTTDLQEDLINPPFDEFLEDEHIVHIPNFECEVDDEELNYS
jgi:hypothetical protein